MNLLELSLPQLAGINFDCACGKSHKVGIDYICCENGAISKIPQVIESLGAKQLYVLFDENTLKAAGEQVLPMLASFNYHSYTYGANLVPDEACIGAGVLNLNHGDDLIVAVGSGTLNDTARLLSTKLNIPYIIICTAPSMDGYASTVSPMIINKMKITLDGVYPKAIIADINIMKNAPMDMLYSGFGDIMGKFTALADWVLAKEVNGEYLCPQSFQLMQKAVKSCTDNAAGLKVRDEAAVLAVTEGLIYSGIAMGLVGNSRPASGAEHHMAHYWEVDLLSRSLPHPLHGNCVGVTAIISAFLYEKCPELKQLLLQAYPSKEIILSFMKLSGAIANPKELGIDKELFHRSVLHAMEIRERYTILRYLNERQGLAAYANELTCQYYN